jgi:hypothetical protein
MLVDIDYKSLPEKMSKAFRNKAIRRSDFRNEVTSLTDYFTDGYIGLMEILVLGQLKKSIR